MFGKLSVRNIPEQIFQALERLAERNDRSTEGEARQAIRHWVGPLLVDQERSSRRQQLAERLSTMLMQVNMGRQRPLLVSQLAEKIGAQHAESVENWFLGVEEPSFAQLVAIAGVLGVDPDFLKHGDASIFPVELHSFTERPFEDAEWLLRWTEPERGTATDQVLTTLHLIRESSEDGSLLIVKESAEHHYVTYTTGIHVSEVIGAGGQAALASLFVTLELLYKRHAVASNVMVIGHQMRSDDVAQLRSGKTNPGALLLGGRTRTTWWEDIWDRDMAAKHEYWPGWRALSERILLEIAERRSLSDVRKAVRKGARSQAEAAALADEDRASTAG